MAAKLITDYASYPGVVNFTDQNHPGYGFPYLILTGNDKGSFTWKDSIQGNSHTMMFCIPWENMATFRQFVLAGSQVVMGALTRTLPMQSPLVSIFPTTYAMNITGAGDGSDANVSSTRLYADCILAVEFQTLVWTPEGSQPFIEISASGSADYDTIPNAKLVFAGNGEAIEHDAGVLVGQVTWNITAYQVPDTAAWLAVVSPMKGKINSDVITLFGTAYDVGTLLIPTFEMKLGVDSSGVVNATTTVPIIQRDIPWNQGFRSDGTLDTIVVSGTSVYPYESAAFTPLFTT